MVETITYSFKEIGDRIYNKMVEIQNGTWRLGAVYNHDIKIEDGVSLPAVIITPSNWTVDILDSCSLQNQINYTVRLIDRINNNYSDVEDNLRVVADLIIKGLESIGQITRSNAEGLTVRSSFSYQWGFVDTQEPFRVFQVACQFTAIEK